MLFFYSKLGSFWYGSPCRTLQIYTGGFSSARFTVCQPKNAAFCSTVVFQQCFATSLLVSNNHIRATSLSKSYLKESFKAVVLRPILWATLQIKSRTVDVYRGVSAVFQHNHPYANNLRLSLLISLTGKQTDWAAYTQTQANGWLTR